MSIFRFVTTLKTSNIYQNKVSLDLENLGGDFKRLIFRLIRLLCGFKEIDLHCWDSIAKLCNFAAEI